MAAKIAAVKQSRRARSPAGGPRQFHASSAACAPGEENDERASLGRGGAFGYAQQTRRRRLCAPNGMENRTWSSAPLPF